MVFRLVVISLFISLTAAAEKKSVAQIDGYWNQSGTYRDRHNIYITKVDGKRILAHRDFKDRHRAVEITPGLHTLEVNSSCCDIAHASRPSKPKLFSIDAQSCVRYILVAQHDRESTEWEVVLLGEKPIKYCSR